MKTNQPSPTPPWYNPLRISIWRSSGKGAAIATLLLKNRPLLTAQLKEVDVETLKSSMTLDVIETFLKCENLKIVVDEKQVRDDLTLEVELEDIDDLVTEELADIYSEQGLIEAAKEIYLKLSLLNSEKSVYFAELIAKLELLEQQDR